MIDRVKRIIMSTTSSYPSTHGASYWLKNTGIFLGCLVLCQAAGALGTIATIPNIPTWYASLTKPSFQPPNWLFGPVWTLLYTLMAVALYVLIKAPSSPQRSRAIRIFVVQLLLNTIWSFLFFQFHWLGISLVEILLLLTSIVAFSIAAWPVNRIATYCFLPYIAWVSFASVLNGYVWYLN